MSEDTRGKKKTGGASLRILGGAAAIAALSADGCLFAVGLGAVRECAALADAFPGGQAPEALGRVLSALRLQLWLAGALLPLTLALAVLAYLLQIRPIRRSSERLAYDATHDILTGLYNRTAFERVLNAPGQSPWTLVLIDVDHFKAINDAHGHAAGDMALRRVAESLRRCFRAEDHICRIGGDEFAVLLAGVGAGQRAAMEEKFRRLRQELAGPAEGLPSFTVSMGVAFWDRENGTDSLFKDADAALYRVKNSGRDGCAFY